jgi:hypothetical protein
VQYALGLELKEVAWALVLWPWALAFLELVQ